MGPVARTAGPGGGAPSWTSTPPVEHVTSKRFARVLAASLVLALGAATPSLEGCGANKTADPSANASRVCKVTSANGSTPPGQTADPGWHGLGGLWTYLGPKSTIVATRDPAKRPEGTLVGRVQSDGSIYAKFPWFRDRRAWGKLTIRGSPLYGRSARLTAKLGARGANASFIPSSLIFGRTGCWKVSAQSGKASLSLVMRVADRLSQ